MPKQMQYVCKQCEYSTTRKFNLERHEKKHKIYFNNNIHQNERQQIIQEPIQINGAPNHESHHNIQSGAGSTVIPIEKI